MNRNYNYYQNIKENLQRQLADLTSALDWLNSQDAVDALEEINREDNVVLQPQEMAELINSTIDDTHRQIEDVNAKLMTIQTIQNTWDDSPVPITRRPLRRRPSRPLRRARPVPPPEIRPEIVYIISDDDDDSPPPIRYLPSTPPGSPPHSPPSTPPGSPHHSPPSTPPSSPPRRGGLGASSSTKRNKRIVKSRKSKKMQHSRKRTKRSNKNKIR